MTSPSLNWANPYIDKLAHFSDLIVGTSNSNLSEDEVSKIKGTTQSHPQLIAEFGSGSGMHLIGQAERNPAGFYVGFELRFKRVVKTAEKAAAKNLTNILVIRNSALLAPELFAPGSLAGVYVNFPDPWDKKRWKKHRLLSDSFLDQIAMLLKPGGFFSYKTDHKAYYDETVSLISHKKMFSIEQQSRSLHTSQYSEGNIKSEFELLFCSKKLPTYYLYAVKI